MRRIVFTALLVACHPGGDPTPPPDEPAAAAPTSWTIKAGDRLERIAEAAYGSRHYAHTIELVDQVKAEKLEVDQVVPLPPIEEIVKDAPEAHRIAQAVRRWNVVERAVAEARRGQRPLDEETALRLRRAARDALVAALAQPGTRVARELVRVATAMRLIARGGKDANSYDLDAIDLRLSFAVEDVVEKR